MINIIYTIYDYPLILPSGCPASKKAKQSIVVYIVRGRYLHNYNQS